MTIKNRWIDVDKSLCGTSWFTINGGPKANVQQIFCNLHGIEAMSDSGPHRYPLGNDAFQVLRSTVKSRPAIVHAYGNSGGITFYYDGKIFAQQYAGNNPQPPPAPLQSTMLGMGVKGWYRYKPTSRQGALAQAVLELKDFHGMIEAANLAKIYRERAKGFLHHAGNQYLNYQFGWVPFLSDVRDLIKNAHNMQKKLDQLARDNGKWVRRRGTIDKSFTTSSTIASGSYYSQPSMVSYCYAGPETHLRTQTEQIRYWFSAMFKYYIAPPAVGRLGLYMEAEHVNRILYGTDLSPSLVYQLIPWSWLVDWFSSAGKSIANMWEDQADNLVAKYAYVMHSHVVSDLHQVFGQTSNGQHYIAEQDYRTEVKARTAATPYGFYAIPPTLSDKQIGILTALGLTRRGIGH